MPKARPQAHPTPRVVSSGSVSRPRALPKPRPVPVQPTITRRVGPFGTNKNG